MGYLCRVCLGLAGWSEALEVGGKRDVLLSSRASKQTACGVLNRGASELAHLSLFWTSVQRREIEYLPF